MLKKPHNYFICSIVGILSLLSCQQKIPQYFATSGACDASNSSYSWLVDENYSFFPTEACGPTAICGTLSYQKRIITVNGEDALLSGDDCLPPFPIQHAQVELVDKDNTSLVYATTSTDKNGFFAFIPLPAGPNQFAVKLYSKTTSTDLFHRINVMDNSGQRENYQVLFNPVFRGQRVNYVAPIQDPKTGVHLAGAYNILSVMTRAQQRMLDDLGAVFENDLEVFWESGGPDGSYFNPDYNIGSPGAIFVKGGDGPGLQAEADTDEFDDPVLLHELAHFIDFNFSSFDTFGGFHYKYAVLPRLAWGEGWPNFFGVYLGSDGPGDTSPYYTDTAGYGATGLGGGVIDMETNIDTATFYERFTDGQIVSLELEANGGQYESAVYHTLWDLYDTNSEFGYDNGSYSIAQIWAAYTDLKNDRSGLNNFKTSTGLEIRGMDNIHVYLDSLRNRVADPTLISNLEIKEGLNSYDLEPDNLFPPKISLTNGQGAADSADPQAINWSLEDEVKSICHPFGWDRDGDMVDDPNFFCWLSGRYLWQVPGHDIANGRAYWNTSYNSRRFFRLETDGLTDPTVTVFLKVGCLNTFTSTTGEIVYDDYSSFGCVEPANNNATGNDFQQQTNQLTMWLWRAPEIDEPYPVGDIDGSHLYVSPVEVVGSSGNSAGDDDDYDGDPQAGGEELETAITGDLIDDNQGSRHHVYSLEGNKVYFIEVNGLTDQNSATAQTEGKFRIHACHGSFNQCRDNVDWDDTNATGQGDTGPAGLGSLEDW